MCNVASKEEGTIDPEQEKRLLEFCEWFRPNSEAIYETITGLPVENSFNRNRTQPRYCY